MKFFQIMIDAAIFMQFPIVLGLCFLCYKAAEVFSSRGSRYIAIGWLFNLIYLTFSTLLKLQVDSGIYFLPAAIKPTILYLDVSASFFFLVGATKMKWFDGYKRSIIVQFLIAISIGVGVAATYEYDTYQTVYTVACFDLFALVLMACYFYYQITSLKKFNPIIIGSCIYILTQFFSFKVINHEWGFLCALLGKSLMLYGFHLVFIRHAAEKTNFLNIYTLLDNLIGATFHEIAKPIGKMEKDFEDIYLSEKMKPNISELVKRSNSLSQSFQRMQAIFMASLNLYEEKTNKKLDWAIYARKKRTKELTSLNFLVEQAYLNSITNREKKVGFHHEYAGNAYIIGNSYEIIESITNIINNAIDAVDENIGMILIRTAAATENSDKYLELEIIDNGTGIKREILHKVTDIGVTTKKGAGHGFGLWMAKNLIEANGASLEIISPYLSRVNHNKNRGTMLKLRFKKIKLNINENVTEDKDNTDAIKA